MRFQELPKLRKTDIFVITGILVLCLFMLPGFGLWHINYSAKIQAGSVYNSLLAYQHPQIPLVKNQSLPRLQSQNYILIDGATNTVLLSKNPHERVYPASTTKLATAITALNIYPLEELITVPLEYKDGQTIKLQVGEKITVKSLVTALLVFSANDAAFNLAAHHEQGIEGFVKQMNYFAAKYNLKDTHFVNFDGLHSPDHYTSVYDLSQLGRIAIKNPVVREMVKTRKTTVSDNSNTIVHPLETTNELLGVVPEIEGLKTGWTPEAGGCFVGLINIGGHELISVVAQSPDRFGDTTRLIDWAKDNVTWTSYRP